MINRNQDRRRNGAGKPHAPWRWRPRASFDKACFDMVETLRYARSIQWWAQFEDGRAA